MESKREFSSSTLKPSLQRIISSWLTERDRRSEALKVDKLEARNSIYLVTLSCHLLTNLIVFPYVKMHQDRLSHDMLPALEYKVYKNVFYAYIHLIHVIYCSYENLHFQIIDAFFTPWYVPATFTNIQTQIIYHYRLQSSYSAILEIESYFPKKIRFPFLNFHYPVIFIISYYKSRFSYL